MYDNDRSINSNQLRIQELIAPLPEFIALQWELYFTPKSIILGLSSHRWVISIDKGSRKIFSFGGQST